MARASPCAHHPRSIFAGRTMRKMRMTTKKQAPFVTWIVTLALMVSTCATLTLNQRTNAQSERRELHNQSNSPLLSKYAIDLSNLALNGKLTEARDHESTVERLVARLTTSRKTPVIVSESDVDRAAIARAVAFRVASGDVPEGLDGKHVFSLSLDALAKGARTS